MQPTFDMDALRTMVVGTELGSFARAAVKLGRSQSAISMQLKKLELQAGRPLFSRNGRGLMPTEAGDALLAYARRIITLNDEAAAFLGATAAAASVRIGLPQDMVDDVLTDVITAFSRQRPDVHLDVRAGRNYALGEDVRTGRLDLALAFSMPGSDAHGTRIALLPMLWLGRKGLAKPPGDQPIPLVLFDHPCLFRQTALQALEGRELRWRLALTTPSLPGIWAALRACHGITVRTAHRLPPDITEIGGEFGLPRLPAVELRLHAANELSPAAATLQDIMTHAVRSHVTAGVTRVHKPHPATDPTKGATGGISGG
jgi:DNA-binding transcriptional LysR family regulator